MEAALPDFGFTSLLPPLIAIALALLTRRVLLPLATGILVGAALLGRADSEADWGWATLRYFTQSIENSITDHDHMMVLSFTLLLGMMVGVIEIAGSMRRAIQRLARRVKDRRGVQTLIAASGLAVFFDDYANTLLVGGTMQSTSDRFGISRAKLAYLVDSTAAPVAGLALVSTWVATELSYLQAGIDASAYSQSSSIRVFDFFLQSIPYRFYPWFALVLVFIIARTGRDFGPMRRAEQEAVDQHHRDTSTARVPGSSEQPDDASSPQEADAAAPSTWQDAAAALGPIAVCLIAVLTTLVVTGQNEASSARAADDSVWLHQVRWAGDVIGSGDSYLALVIGGGCGLAFAVLLALSLSRLSLRGLGRGVFVGALQMMPAMAVLWLAWALSAMTGKEALDTGGYLASVLSDQIDIRLLPTCVFILSGGIAFATGTSWGTMAIVTPIAVSLVLDMQAGSAAVAGEMAVNSPLALATFSSVLAGAIFGDHCSPLSDTTVLSSRACGCDHVLHVRTQIPYALLGGAVCVLTGTLPVACGVPVWICLGVGLICLLAAVHTFGRPVAATEPAK
ncbi:Na+/H+ antiporter NhaC family protein [Allorhodopirellula solitaria]|uniref:Malate-2H(+)/Na(+)-lactate antiporter n=1 Tax=Allorhodopirellula solitaria TaxID=2527987 RepID=A0A5C5YD43_9BACT|nr:Na+/H+ antiporter NhaC family protein [Allorhodopirellula solitaria]TWT72868.1 Malate-2H(+)/Na(+)-lactate antiporter [Allorhodopirellula solitaria]